METRLNEFCVKLTNYDNMSDSQLLLTVTFGDNKHEKFQFAFHDSDGNLAINYSAKSSREFLLALSFAADTCINFSSLNIRFIDIHNIHERSILLESVVDILQSVKSLRSLSVKGVVSHQALEKLLHSDLSSTLTYLSLRSGVSDSKTKTNSDDLFEVNLIAYLEKNKVLKALHIHDSDEMLTSVNHGKLKQAICDHSTLSMITFCNDRSLLCAGNNPWWLENDPELIFAVLARQEKADAEFKMDQKNIYEWIRSYLISFVTSYESIERGEEQEKIKIADCSRLLGNLDRYIKLLECLADKSINVDLGQNEDLSVLAKYAGTLKVLSEFKQHELMGEEFEDSKEINELWRVIGNEVYRISNSTDSLNHQLLNNVTPRLVEIINRNPFKFDVKESLAARDTFDGNTLVELKKNIARLAEYGEELKQKGYPASKYQMVSDVAALIKDQVSQYMNGKITVDQASTKINDHLEIARPAMRGDRRWKDIIAHIALCATGIGLIILGIKWAKTGDFFLNSTEREKRLEEVAKSLKGSPLRK